MTDAQSADFRGERIARVVRVLSAAVVLSSGFFSGALGLHHCAHPRMAVRQRRSGIHCSNKGVRDCYFTGVSALMTCVVVVARLRPPRFSSRWADFLVLFALALGGRLGTCIIASRGMEVAYL